MSIENNLTSIAESLHKIADCLASMSGAPAMPQVAPQAPQAVPQAPVPMPQVPQMPPVPQAPSAQVLPMPGMPQAPQVPQAGYPPSPLSNPADVMNYCVQKWKVLGPAKGAEMQAILTALGHANLNTLRPEQYAEFYAKTEALTA